MVQNPFEKVLDTSIWQDAESLAVVNKKDPFIRIGIVLKVEEDTKAKDARYLVEVRDRNDKVTAWCRLMTRMGGVYNYEDFTVRGYTTSPLSAVLDYFAMKAGDFVVVAFLNGEAREGVILGGLKHPARSSKLKPADGPAYGSEFNGVETTINKDGEYTLTFKGVPINEALLKAPAAVPVLPPIYNPIITGSYIKLDKTGSIELNDKSIALPQSIKIDKSGGKIQMKAGMVEFSMDKFAQAVKLKSLTTEIESTVSIKQKTVQFAVDATATIKLKALKIAIGSDGVELFDQLIQLIDSLGKVQVVSPVGPCTPLMATPQWIAVELIKAKLTVLKGSL